MLIILCIKYEIKFTTYVKYDVYILASKITNILSKNIIEHK